MSNDEGNILKCLTCGAQIPRNRSELYQKLGQYEHLCICNWCVMEEYLPGKKVPDPYSGW